MDRATIEDLNKKIEAAVDRALQAEVDARLSKVRVELDNTVRDLARAYLTKQRDVIQSKIEAWFSANVDRVVEGRAKEMVDEALGEVKRRVLGRR